MRTSYATWRGAALLKTPSYRQQAGRRRLAAICAILGLALVSGVVGSLMHPAKAPPSHPTTTPFSYFPSE
jgi:hypothetical protein